MTEKRCAICGEIITDSNRSSEHIIHNAIGGTLEDDGIYCRSCNSKYGTKEDKQFAAIFAPFMHELGIRRTRKTKGTPYSGYLLDGSSKLYEAKYKDGKVTSIHDKDGVYVREKSENFVPFALKFELDNPAFKKGLAKIAFNYAVYCGIEPSLMERIFDADSRRLHEKLCVFPFLPLTVFDGLIESYVDPKLYHALRIFSIDDCLFAYVELFSTFQHYVLLSERYSGSDVEESYCSFIEQSDISGTTAENFTPSSCEDAKRVIQEYGIDYDDIVSRLTKKHGRNPDTKEIFDGIGHEVYEKYRKNIYVASYEDVASKKFQGVKREAVGENKFPGFHKGESFYVLVGNKLNMSRYKKFLPDGRVYPEAVAEACYKNFKLARSYGYKKFHMLELRLKT